MGVLVPFDPVVPPVEQVGAVLLLKEGEERTALVAMDMSKEALDEAERLLQLREEER